MPLIVREARDEDAASIAAIHYAAYYPQLGHAQAYGRVPLAEHVRYDGFNTRKFIAASSSLHARILVVEDSATEEIISTAKWFLPVGEGETAKDPSSLPKLDPDWLYLNIDLLTVYNASIHKAEQSTWEGKRCYSTLLPHPRFFLLECPELVLQDLSKANSVVCRALTADSGTCQSAVYDGECLAVSRCCAIYTSTFA